MKIEDKHILLDILERYTDMIFERYYITNPPQITKVIMWEWDMVMV